MVPLESKLKSSPQFLNDNECHLFAKNSEMVAEKYRWFLPELTSIERVQREQENNDDDSPSSESR